MKGILNHVKEFLNDESNPKRKTILFFGFYFIFFVILFGILFFKGDKNYLFQEYEMGNSSDFHGELSYNCVFDYKVTVDGVYHDYYGKKNNSIESFKYNNLDYYRDHDEYFVYKDLWIKSDNPYQFSELLNYDNIFFITQQATLLSKDEENEKVIYHFVISSNTLNKILYEEETDYDEDADSLEVVVDSSNHIEKITFQLNQFCKHRENCNDTLLIEMNFEMFGSVTKIDNPME